MMTVAPIGNRYAYAFMSSSSLLSCPIMIGQKVISFDDFAVLLSHGLTTPMKHMRTPRSQRSRLLHDLNEIAVCKANDTSMMAIFRSVTSDYDYYVGRYGRLANVDIGDIGDIGDVILKLNTVPQATLGFHKSFEVSLELLNNNGI